MSPDGKDAAASSPDRFVERDVTDLKVEIGKFDERLRNIKDNMVTKEHLANRRADGLKLSLTLLIPVLAAALGALAIMFSGVVQTVLTS